MRVQSSQEVGKNLDFGTPHHFECWLDGCEGVLSEKGITKSAKRATSVGTISEEKPRRRRKRGRMKEEERAEASVTDSIEGAEKRHPSRIVIVTVVIVLVLVVIVVVIVAKSTAEASKDGKFA